MSDDSAGGRRKAQMLPREQMIGVTQAGGKLLVDWVDGHHSVFHFIWLRDNCNCTQCRHANGQRLLDTAAIPPDIAPARPAQASQDELAIEWFGGHLSRYSAGWLRAHCYSA